LKLSYGLGNKFLSSDLPSRGEPGLGVSSQFDVVHSFHGNLSDYGAISLCLQPGGLSGGAETGLKWSTGKWVLGGGLQASKDINSPMSYYGTANLMYTSKQYSVGLQFDQPITHQSGDRPTVSLMGAIHF
jgi:hypothetical protein